MEILISYAPYRHQRYSSTNSLKRTAVCMVKERVCFPYEFTLLSNVAATCTTDGKFVSPTNLHCSQTYKQTKCHSLPFVSPTNLHCSQTMRSTASVWNSLFPLRIYTALKQSWVLAYPLHSLFPLRIYTALKHKPQIINSFKSLFPLRIYTALKPRRMNFCTFLSLFPLRIYTALKL